jgi:ABC-type hemin transport system substrate-binding protein
MKSSIVFCFLLVLSCAQTEQEPVVGERIISLSPSITATLTDIGGLNFVVGRSAFCDVGDKKIPAVGDLHKIDYERLLVLRPTKVFVQKTAAGIDAHLQQLAQEEYFTLHSWEIERIKDIKLLHDDLLSLLELQGNPMQLSLEETEVALPSPILVMTPGSDRGAGLCFGKNTYLDDVLTMMGGTNALQKNGWVSLSLEDIAILNPAAILLVSDSNFTVGDGIASLEITVIPFIHEDVLIPSSKIVNVARALQQKLVEK